MKALISVEEYLSALKENRLLGCKCHECGFITAPPRWACRNCAAHNSELVELSGQGQIATFTAVYVPTHHRYGKTPYLVAMVEMSEGPWVLGNLVGIEPASATLNLIGQKVKMNNHLYHGVEPPDGIAPLFVLEK
jgi:uncharacterized OB-fold protein